MEEQLHLAAQYLAAAAIGFVKVEDDDRHTNLGYDPTTATLHTRALSENGVSLIFRFTEFSLEWETASQKEKFPLDGKTHAEVVQWLEQRSKETLGKSYVYHLHYDLPYAIDSNYTFKLTNANGLKRLRDLRTLAQNALQKVRAAFDLATEIRIWPHHFDTGGYAALPNTEIYIGFGMAIPDTVFNDHYFYLSAYHNNKMLSTSGFKKLDQGSWVDDGFKGAILSAKETTESEIIDFFKAAVFQLQNLEN